MKAKKVLFVCSAGGHLAQILELEDLRKRYEYLLVTEKVEATKPLMGKYSIEYLKPTSQSKNLRFWFNLGINFFRSLIILLRFKPDVIITTGSHTAVPLCLFGKLFGKKVVWILSYARVKTRSKSADLIYPIADRFLVQWEAVREQYPKSKYVGGIY